MKIRIQIIDEMNFWKKNWNEQSINNEKTILNQFGIRYIVEQNFSVLLHFISGVSWDSNDYFDNAMDLLKSNRNIF